MTDKQQIGNEQSIGEVFCHRIDTVVKGDDALSGIKGRIGIGVLSHHHPHVWWVGDFGKRIDSSIQTNLPDKLDTVLLIGEAEADSLLNEKSLASKNTTFEIKGNGALLGRFAERYFGANNMIDIMQSRVQVPT